MKHTLENILKVLKAEQKLLYELQKSYKKDNDEERATNYMKERMEWLEVSKQVIEDEASNLSDIIGNLEYID